MRLAVQASLMQLTATVSWPCSTQFCLSDAWLGTNTTQARVEQPGHGAAVLPWQSVGLVGFFKSSLLGMQAGEPSVNFHHHNEEGLAAGTDASTCCRVCASTSMMISHSRAGSWFALSGDQC